MCDNQDRPVWNLRKQSARGNNGEGTTKYDDPRQRFRLADDSPPHSVRTIKADLHASWSSARPGAEASLADSVATLEVMVAVFLFVNYEDVSRRQAKRNRGEVTVV